MSRVWCDHYFRPTTKGAIGWSYRLTNHRDQELGTTLTFFVNMVVTGPRQHQSSPFTLPRGTLFGFLAKNTVNGWSDLTDHSQLSLGWSYNAPQGVERRLPDEQQPYLLGSHVNRCGDCSPLCNYAPITRKLEYWCFHMWSLGLRQVSGSGCYCCLCITYSYASH